MENPTEDQVRAMSNREFASLMRSQAEMIDRSIDRSARTGTDGGDAQSADEAVSDDRTSHRRRQKQKV